MSAPDISIIIPVVNEEEILGKLLNYLYECRGKSTCEIIIADGGSSDGTVAIAEKLGARVIHCHKKGRAAQMNIGAEHAKGSILYFLHADTFPPPDFLDHIRQSFQNGYKSGCFRLGFDDPHPILKFYGWCTRFQLTVFRFGDQSLFVEKTLFQRVKGFEESMIVMEDQQMVRELKKVSGFCVMEGKVTTSARRYRMNGMIRLQAVFLLIVIMYYAGAQQNTLVRVYNRFINK